jgi:hypothetical protein
MRAEDEDDADAGDDEAQEEQEPHLGTGGRDRVGEDDRGRDGSRRIVRVDVDVDGVAGDGCGVDDRPWRRVARDGPSFSTSIV